MKQPRPWQVILGSAAIGALGSFATHSILPALSAIREHLHSDIGVTQLIVSVALLSLGAGQLIVAPLSDHIGRRPIALTGLALYVAASIAAAFAWRIEWLIAVRAIQAFGCGAAISVARATIVDYFGPSRASTGIACSAIAILLVPMFVVSVGGYLAEFLGLRWIFGCCALLGTAVLVFSWMRIAETHPPTAGERNRVRIGHSYWTLLTSPDYMAFVCYGSFLTAAMYTVITNGPYVVIDVMHMAPSTYGNLFLIPAVGSFSGFFAAARFGRRIGALRLMQTGLVIALLASTVMAGLLLLHVWHPAVFFIPAMVLGFSNALSTPSSTSSAIAIHPQIAGAASGVLGFANLAVSAATTQIAAALANHTPIPFAWMVLVQVLAAAAVMLYIRRRRAPPLASQEYDGSETVTL